MVKLVGVYQGHRTKPRDCLSRRQLPLEIEPDLTMVMALDEFCIACGPAEPVRKCEPSADLDLFYRNYNCLDKDELSACLMVTGEELMETLGHLVPCVGCRRSVEMLYHTLVESGDSALEPLMITKDGVVSVNREHLSAPDSLANLFCHQIVRLAAHSLEQPSSKKGGVRKGGRCPAHSLGHRRLCSTETWLDTWDCMEKECREEVVVIPFSAIRTTLDKYLTKHNFCGECSHMVNKAFTLFMEEGKEPALAIEEKKTGTTAASSKLNKDGSLNLYWGITACTKDSHVHVQCDPCFISQLLVQAEPELIGVKQERHAKTIEKAQKEVIICIGITLFQRFQKIEQKIREGEQSCDLLFLVAAKTLRKSLDISAERKRGFSDLERLCEELDQERRAEERRKAKKREKKTKSKQQLRRKEQKMEEIGELSNDHIREGNCGEESDSGLGSGGSHTSIVEHLKSVDAMSATAPTLALPLRPRAACSGQQQRYCCLLEMLREDEEEQDDEEGGISQEEIQLFHSRLPHLKYEREKLREKLRKRFAALCLKTSSTNVPY